MEKKHNAKHNESLKSKAGKMHMQGTRLFTHTQKRKQTKFKLHRDGGVLGAGHDSGHKGRETGKSRLWHKHFS